MNAASCARPRHVTHPAFGCPTRTLEAWVGVPLVDRTRTPVQLTSVGQALQRQGQPLLDTLLQTRDALRRRHPELGGEVLRIATGRTLAHTLVADWLGRLTRQPCTASAWTCAPAP
jgi:DNA-binding transcriptional LysR family regulator